MPALTRVVPNAAWSWRLSARSAESSLSHGRRLAWTTAALAASGSTTLAFNVVMARALSRDDFGHVARVYAGGMIVAQLTMASVAPALMRTVAQSGDDGERLRLARSATRLLVLTVAPASLLYLVLGTTGIAPGDPLSLLLGWALAFVYPLYFGLKAILFALGRVRTYALLEGASDVAFFLLLAVFALRAPSLGLLVFPLAYGLFVLVTATLIRRSAPEPLPITVDRPFLRFGAFALVATYASVAQGAAVVLITGLLGSSSDAAEIAAVLALSTPLALLPQAAGILSFVGAARGEDDFNASLRQTVRIVSLIVGSACFSFALLAHPVVDVVLGARYAEVVPSLLVVLVGLSAALATTPVANALAGQGRVGVTACISASGFSLAALGALVAVPSFGVLGAAVAITAAYAATAAALVLVGRSRFGLAVADVAPAAALAAAGLLLGTADLSLAVRVGVLVSVLAVALAYRFVRVADLRVLVPAASSQTALVGASALAALGMAMLLAVRPQAAFLVAGVILVAWAASIELRYLVAALLVYLPFEGIALTLAPGGAVIPLRYGPEFLIDAVVLVHALPRLRIIRERSSALLIPLLLVVCFWAASGLWNAVDPGTAIIGLRSELRFLPLLVVPLLSRDPERDARFYARLLALVASIEVVVLAAEILGGGAVRSLFSTNYEITVGGVQVTALKTSEVFGTFPHYNLFGTFLVFAFAVVAAAGSRGLGVSRRIVVALLIAFAVAIVVSGSRESGIALLACALVIAWIRFRPPLAVASVAACVTALVMVFLIGSERPPDATAASSRASVVGIARFETLLTPSIFSTDPNDPRSNFRLYFLLSNAELVREQSPLFGFGIGSASDPRTLLDGTNPIYRSKAGRRAAEFSYFYDGNWGFLLLETGIGGLAALTVLFIALARIGLRLTHWMGSALLGLLAAILVLGLFEPILQLRAPGMLLWLVVGLTLALADVRRRERRQ